MADSEGHAGVVFEGKLRWAFLSPDALTRLDADSDQHAGETAEALQSQGPVKMLTFRFNQDCPLYLHDFLRTNPDGTEAPMTVSDFEEGPWIEIPRN